MNVMDLKYALMARACSPELADEICAKLARLEAAEAELKRLGEQEPVAVFKGAHDGRFVIDWLHGYIPPVNLALYAAPVPPAAAQPAICAWHEDEDGAYDTGCGNRFEIIDGSPADNEMTFCPYCGGAIDEHHYNDMPEGE